MINGLGVLGYGVGGIEAEAVLLGQPLYQPMPRDRRRPAQRRAAGDDDRDRPRARHHRDAARVRRRRRVRRVRGRRPRRPVARRPGDDLQHEPRVRRDEHAVPDRRGDAHVPPPDRASRRARGPRGALREGAGPVARARRRAGVRRADLDLDVDRPSRAAPAAGPGRASLREASGKNVQTGFRQTGASRETKKFGLRRRTKLPGATRLPGRPVGVAREAERQAVPIEAPTGGQRKRSTRSEHQSTAPSRSPRSRRARTRQTPP